MVSFTAQQLYPRARWIGPTAGLDPMEKRQFSRCRESNPGRSVIFMGISVKNSNPTQFASSAQSLLNKFDIGLYILQRLQMERVL
jgi:hypothetical protein